MGDLLTIKLKKLHPDAKTPSRKEGDIGFDISSVEEGSIAPGQRKLIKTGIALADDLPLVNDNEKKMSSYYDGFEGPRKSYVTFQGNKTSEFHSVSYLQIQPRSGLALKHGIDVFAGVIDRSYRGEIGVILYNSSNETFTYNVGDRIAQIITHPANDDRLYDIKFEFVEDEQKATSRGEDGFGSTGIK